MMMKFNFIIFPDRDTVKRNSGPYPFHQKKRPRRAVFRRFDAFQPRTGYPCPPSGVFWVLVLAARGFVSFGADSFAFLPDGLEVSFPSFFLTAVFPGGFFAESFFFFSAPAFLSSTGRYSMIAISAPSPTRNPVRTIRVYPPSRPVNRPPPVSNTLSGGALSVRSENTRRREGRGARFPKVINRSASRRSSLAFGTVVSIRSA